MPKVVDHVIRRQEIAGATLRVVSRAGLKGTNLRSVAQEARCSTGSLNHYFCDKQALLMGALREATRNVGDRMLATRSSTRGAVDRLQKLLEAGMPLDEARAATCRIFFHLSSEGFNEPELIAELAGYYAWWRGQVQEAIEQVQKSGEFLAFDAAELSETLVAVTEGLGVQGLIDERAMSPARMRRRLKESITLLRTDKVNSGGSQDV